MNIFRAHTKNAWGWVIEVYIILFWYFVCVHFILRDLTLVRRCSTGQTNHFSILPRPNVSAEYSLYCCSDKMSSHNTRRFFASIYTFSFSKFYVFFSDLISDFWSKKRQKDKKTKRQKNKKTKRQKTSTKKTLILWCQSSFSLLRCFICSFIFVTLLEVQIGQLGKDEVGLGLEALMHNLSLCIFTTSI